MRRRRGAKGHSEGRGREAPGKEPGRRGRSSSSPPPPAPGIAARGERLTGGRWHTLGDGGDWPRLRGAPAAGCLSEGEGAETSPRLALPGSLGGWRLRIVPSREPGERGRGGPKERAVGKGLLEERRGHREARTGWRPAALPFFHPGELRKPQRAEAGVTGWRAGDSLSTRALMHKGGGSWRSAQSFLITVPSVAVAHVRVPRPTPTTPRPGCLLPAQWQSGCQGSPTSSLPHPARFLSSLFHF